ncbi:hypothetical protein BDZ94DRAFT_891099 [Collybia nuda]|uniref:Uncharacterized protein n=1 Tax=Collybia nuda TaxID=64659 RepID=A0A9P5XZV6_9AGAR|nr:hypothetical protein BDZ94DRAFT_891099 [Collybia nuda]
MGIYLISFFHCIHGLLWLNGRLKSRNNLNYLMLFAAIWLFTFSTLDLIFGFQLNISAFFIAKDGPTAYFTETSNWVNVMKLITFIAQTFMADSILLYRCWIIYNRRWKVVIIPILMWLAETVCGAIAVSIETTLGNSSILTRTLAPFIISMLTLTLSTNILVTSLMVFRIRLIQININQLMMDGARAPTSPTIRNVLLILIESGAVYTAAILMLLCTYIIAHNASYLISDCLVQIIGIVFNLILIRVARGTAIQPITETPPTILEFRHDTMNTETPEDNIELANVASKPGDTSLVKR